MKTNKKIESGISYTKEVLIKDFKVDEETGYFTCYGNVKNIIDYADERTIDGCFKNTIMEHSKNLTMPLMLWSHDRKALPVGRWIDWKEDEKGLWLKGKLSQTQIGKDLEILAKDGAILKFSIGYSVDDWQYNEKDNCYDLISISIKEISWVNFACNDESNLITIKSKLEDGKLPTKRELQKILRSTGISKRQAEKIVNNYSEEETMSKEKAIAELANYLTENNIKITL